MNDPSLKIRVIINIKGGHPILRSQIKTKPNNTKIQQFGIIVKRP